MGEVKEKGQEYLEVMKKEILKVFPLLETAERAKILDGLDDIEEGHRIIDEVLKKRH